MGTSSETTIESSTTSERMARRGDVPRALSVAAAWSWRILIVIAAALAVGWLIVQARIVVIPVFVALLAAALLTPMVDRLDRRLPRLLAVWIALLAVMAVFGALAWLLHRPVTDAFDDLRESWDTTRADIDDWLQDGPLSLSATQVDDLEQRVDDVRDDVVSGLSDQPQTTARRIVDTVAGVFLTLVLSFFFLKDGREMWEWVLARVRPMRRSLLRAGGGAAFSAFQGWIRGVAITGLVDAVLIGAALLILGVPAAAPLIILTFLAAFFPIVGATFVGGLATLIALATEGPGTALIVLVVTIVVQQVEGDVVLPIVMRRQVSLHPAVVLVALALGGGLGGLIGAVVAVPLTAAIAAATSAVRATAAKDALRVAGSHAGLAEGH